MTTECLLCGHKTAHKHGKTRKGIQRYKCPKCIQTFPENINTLYYNRHLNPDEVHTILQFHAEGSSLRGVSRISGRAYGTVVSLIRDASVKAQMIHNAETKQVQTEGIVRQQTGRWHRRQNKFGKMWKQTEIITRLIVSYFNWIWSNIRWGTTAAQRAGLTSRQWNWNDIVSYPTVF